MTKDYYKILQVHPDADADIIQSAYRRLSLKYHPDVNSAPGAHTRMQSLNEAFETLKDAERRKRYYREWLRAHPGAPAPRERVVYVDRPEPDNGTPAARLAVEQYFRSISQSLFQNAYALLSRADTDRF